MVNFNPGRGSEQTGVRPALIIQNDIGNQYASTTIVAAITTTIKKYPVTVLLAQGKGGLKQSSMVNLTQILTVDKARLIKRMGHVGDDKIEEIDEVIKVSLGIQ